MGFFGRDYSRALLIWAETIYRSDPLYSYLWDIRQQMWPREYLHREELLLTDSA